MSRVALAGCRAEPLGSYLKALAVLRLVSEQADPEARGWWEQDCFHLESKLDQSALVDFFLTTYRPTPILAPWNGASGFYPKDRKVGIEAIASSEGDRFDEYRRAIALAREIPEVAQGKGGSKTEDDDRRVAVLKACRNAMPDACVGWLDAAVGLSADGKRAFAPILGTGGNEGHLDYSNNFMEHVAELLIQPDRKIPVRELLGNALFGDETSGFKLCAVGQYDPGRAGGANQGVDVKGGSASNPWNFVLTLEGAVAWVAGLYRRQGMAYRLILCSPFTVKPSPVGYSSAADRDKTMARAEIWTPLWSRPARYAEMKALIREGRASLDTKPAQTGLDFAQAACMLGVDRGISGFVRYNLVERRGQGYYIALPAGRFPVGYRKDSDLVRELSRVLDPADRRFPDPPAAYASSRRRVDEAMYDLLLRGGAAALQDLAAALGRLHRWILINGKPVRLPSDLSPHWVDRLQDAPEARIAAALAGMWDRDVGAIRENLDRNSNRFAWVGRDLADRMISVLERRVLTADAAGSRRNPFGSPCEAPVTDAARFLEGSVDDGLLEDLLFAFLLVDRRRKTEPHEAENDVEVWPVYALLKHLFLPHGVASPEGVVQLRPDLTVLSLLKAGRVGPAAEVAVRRLRIAGLCPIEVDYEGGVDGRRLAAALLIPVPYGAALRKPVLKELASTHV